VPIQEEADCNNLQQSNENCNHVNVLQYEGVIEIDEDKPIGQVFSALTQHTPPTVGPTLATLGNRRASASSKPPNTIQLFKTMAPLIQE
jgi:hypothetical protein